MDFLKHFTEPAGWWALIGLGLILAEFMLPGLIIIFFGLGALLVALICVFVDISLNTQLFIFIISSIVMLVSLRRWLKTIFMGKKEGQGRGGTVCEFVGERAVVKAKIERNIPGKVILHGTNWVAEADVAIEEGAAVRIVGQRNITLKVEPLTSEA